MNQKPEEIEKGIKALYLIVKVTGLIGSVSFVWAMFLWTPIAGLISIGLILFVICLVAMAAANDEQKKLKEWRPRPHQP